MNTNLSKKKKTPIEYENNLIKNINTYYNVI